MAEKFPQADLPRGLRGGADAWDGGPAGAILLADYFAAALNATANGSTVTATASLIAGSASASGGLNANVSGQTLTGAASLVAGAVSASGQASGATLAASTSLTAGTVAASGSAAGQIIVPGVSLIAGAASAASDATASGQVLTNSVFFFGGIADNAANGSRFPVRSRAKNIAPRKYK